MSNDPINRLPPPPPLDPLRTASIDAVQPTRREAKQDDTADDETEPTEKHPEPEDQITFTTDVPDALQDGLAHPDTPDAFHISLQAIQDLLEQHRADYAPMDFARLTDQLAFLHTHVVSFIFWPPTLILQEAIDQACAALAQTVPLLPDHT